jgi:hypothetical protein
MSQSYKWWVNCPVCSDQILGGDMKRRWDGLNVCVNCWEPRNPLDLYRPRDVNHVLPYLHTEQETSVGPTYVTAQPTYFCDPYRRQSMADVGTADCAKADITF